MARRATSIHARADRAAATRRLRTPASAASAASRAGNLLVAVTLGVALVGGFVALRVVAGGLDAYLDDGRVATSFGALWIESSEQIAIDRVVHQGHIGFPQAGKPEHSALSVTVRLANTTTVPVELTPARFAFRSGAGEPVPVEGAAFESVLLLPGAVFDARLQFPASSGEQQLDLLFDDPGGSGPIAIDLGRVRFQETADGGHDSNDH